MTSSKISKIYIPPTSSVRDIGNRVDFWFSDDIQDWLPRRQRNESKEDRKKRQFR